MRCHAKTVTWSTRELDHRAQLLTYKLENLFYNPLGGLQRWLEVAFHVKDEYSENLQ